MIGRMRHRISASILGLVVLASVVAWQTRPAGQAGAPASAEARWLRALDAWESGAYPTALEELRQLLRSPAGPEYLERIALLSGELFVTTEMPDHSGGVGWCGRRLPALA
jgi:hypothetical protein